MAKEPNVTPVFTDTEIEALKTFAASGLGSPSEIGSVAIPSLPDLAARLEIVERDIASIRETLDRPAVTETGGAVAGAADTVENLGHLVGWLFRNNHRTVDPMAIIKEGREMAQGSEVLDARRQG